MPLFGDRNGKSALAGRRGALDALDLACSNLVNNVDEGNLIYWVISNAGGMDELDDMMFLNRIKTLRVAHTDGEASAVPHTVEAPYEGTQAAVDMLLRRLYDDFQAFNAAAVSAGDQTATAIRASYAPLDLKADKLERQVTRFIHGLLALLGMEDEPSYTRSQIVNRLEETRALVLMEPYVGAEYVRRKLLTLEGDIDCAEAGQ